VSLLDPDCTVVQIRTVSNEEEVDERKMLTNNNYMKISDKEEEREAKKNKNKRKDMVKVKKEGSGKLRTRKYENKRNDYTILISPLFKKSSL
jgi:hypothetical protein